MSTTAQNASSEFPTAFLAAVFEHLCDQPVSIPLEPTDPRCVLSCVCKGWANIFKSMPHLWDNIRFAAPLSPAFRGLHPLLYNFALYARSNNSNRLTLTLDIIRNQHKGWAFGLVDFVVMPHMHRIKTLTCTIFGNQETTKFLTIEQRRLRTLEPLIDVDEPLSSFQFATSVRFSVFQTAPLPCSAVQCILPWGQLTTLDLGTTTMPPKTFLKILDSAAQQLENAFFSVRFISCAKARRVLWRQSVTMRALRTLRLQLLFPSSDTRLFSKSLLRFPALQYLWIELHDVFQDWDVTLYKNLLHSTSDTLQNLYLTDNDNYVSRRRHRETSYQELEEFFKIIPNIEHLYIPLGINIHATTTEKMATGALLPRLSVLLLGTVNGWPILSMARWRHANVVNTPLEHEIATTSRVFQTAPKPTPSCIKYIHMLVPECVHNEGELVALVKEVQALKKLGITCRIVATPLLPLHRMRTPVAPHSMNAVSERAESSRSP